MLTKVTQCITEVYGSRTHRHVLTSIELLHT